MRRLLVHAVVAVALAGPTAAAAAPPLFIVEGRGWGHGIGLAQYGAYGYAREEGRSYAWILEHYYPGTALGRAPDAAVRVLLADDRRSLTVGSDAPFSVSDAEGRRFELPRGSVELDSSLRVRARGELRQLAGPVEFTRGASYLELGGRPYRGKLVVRTSGGTVAAINHVGLEEYLYGVVPDEMPPTWAMEALKAQAVAARSYAVVSRRTGGVFDVFPDTRSQVYGGVASEEARTNAAIDATAGDVVMHGGRVAHTFFHSTSGGRTAAIEDVWNASPVPYLVSVPDPHDRISPHHRWGPLRFTGSELARRLGSLTPRGSLLDLVVSRNRSRRAESVTARGSRGTTRFAGTSFQSRLDLRSSWFSVGVLSLTGSVRVTFGERASLRGIARVPGAAWLERRVWNGSWERVGRAARTDAGTFRAVARPTATTWYRVASRSGAGLAHRVAVAPLVRLTEVRRGRTLVGFVRPATAGARVSVQRLSGGRWTTVARSQTDASGRFRVGVGLEPGTYRAVATLGRGYAPGASALFDVVAR
jgi:stage II sporulation protein D